MSFKDLIARAAAAMKPKPAETAKTPAKAKESKADGMRQTMRDNRSALSEALRNQIGSDRFGFIGAHRGMFSLIGATGDQVRRMRDDFGVYIVGDGRMSVAGLTAANIPRVAHAIAACCRD